jgi:CBS-domain-containing membrane protein
MSVFTSTFLQHTARVSDGMSVNALTNTVSEPELDKKGRMSFLLALRKFAGDRSAIPAIPSLKSVALAWIGGVLAIAVVAKTGGLLSLPLVLGSFGASCVLLFGYPDVPFSQPRNVIIGHLLSSFIGLAFLVVCGPHWWAMGLATGTAIAAMMLTRTVHPPAGSNPVIVFLYQPTWGFLLYPTLAGALLITCISLIYNNTARGGARYPKYW